MTIRPMTAAEFDAFYRWSRENHARELMDEQNLSREAAMAEAEAELARMLPRGMDTADNHLMTIEAGEPVGFLWTLHEETDGKKQSFLCDLAIWVPHRRRGYARAALARMEQLAAEAGCLQSVLFVSDRNEAARALYEKCGYQILRPFSYGNFIVKEL